MFRITSERNGLTFIHKKFLWWWVKWSLIKTNAVKNNVASENDILHHLTIGSYDFSRGEVAHYWVVTADNNPWKEGSKDEPNEPIIEYVESAEKYKLRHSERFI